MAVGQSTAVSPAELTPVVVRLVSYLGSKAEIARRLNIAPDLLYRLLNTGQISPDLFREIEQLLWEQEKGLYLYNSGEAEVVSTKQLAPVISDFRENWNRQVSPVMTSEYVKLVDERNLFNSIDMLAPLQYLVEKTGIHPRRLTAIQRQEYRFIGLSQADSLLTAMRKQDMLATGEIEVLPNPNWKIRRYLDYMRDRGCF